MQVAVSVGNMQLTLYGNYAGFEVVLSVTGMLVDLSVSAADMWVTIFIVIIQMGISVAFMQVVFSAKHYAHDCLHCNYAGDSFFYSYIGESFK